MQAGRMKYRITLLSPNRTTDRMGSEDIKYIPTRTVHAERVKISGSNSDEVGEHFAEYRVEFNIRDVHKVETNWRVEQLGGHLYTVVAIIPNLDRGFNTLLCDRVNE